MWQERRLKKQESERSIQIASLPASLESLPSSSSSLVSSSKISESSQLRFSKLSPGLKSIIDALPQNRSVIQEVYDGGVEVRGTQFVVRGKNNSELLRTTNNEPGTVVLLQDLHLNSEAQTNNAEILKDLISHQEVGLIGVEGAFTDFNFSKFAGVNEKLSRDVALKYLNQNKIAAHTFLGLTYKSSLPRIIGVDNVESYSKNLQAYYDSQKNKSKITAHLTKEESHLSGEKKKIFSGSLLHFDDLRTAYHKNQVSLGSYVKDLSDLSSGSISNELTIDQFLEALKMESSINFKKVDLERTQVLGKLAKTLSESEMSDLLNQSLAYRLGKLSFGVYYQHLKNLCEEKGISLKITPSFDNYIRYVLLSDGINADQLFESVERLENRIEHELAKSDQEKELLHRSELFSLKQKLVEFSLTSKEWNRYSALRRDARQIYGGRPTINPDLLAFEKFYEEADIRSEKMVEVVRSTQFVVPGKRNPELLRTTHNEPCTAVLITGGFHTSQIAQRLKEQNISYIIVSPKLTKIDETSASSYLSIFAKEKSPLEKLFSGEKLFLSPARVAMVGSNSLNPIEVPPVLSEEFSISAQIQNQVKEELSLPGSDKSITSESKSKVHVLYLEDRQIEREVQVGVFRDLGYEVTAAENGVDALNKLREGKGQFDLVVSDVDMPEMNGIEFYNELKKEFPSLAKKFIFFASTDEETVRYETGESSIPILLKPATMDQLQEKIESVIKKENNSSSFGINGQTGKTLQSLIISFLIMLPLRNFAQEALLLLEKSLAVNMQDQWWIPTFMPWVLGLSVGYLAYISSSSIMAKFSDQNSFSQLKDTPTEKVLNVDIDSEKLNNLRVKVLSEMQSLYEKGPQAPTVSEYEKWVLSHSHIVPIQKKKLLWSQTMKEGLSNTKDYFAQGNLLGMVDNFFIWIVLQIQPPLVSPRLEKGQLVSVTYSPHLRIYPSNILTTSVGLFIFHPAHDLFFSIGGALAFFGFLFFISKYKSSEGHELSHVYQTVLLEQIRRELNLPLTFDELTKIFTLSDFQRPVHKSPGLTHTPPDQERLKYIINDMFDVIERAAKSQEASHMEMDIGIASDHLGLVTRKEHEEFHEEANIAEVLSLIGKEHKLKLVRGMYDFRSLVPNPGDHITNKFGDRIREIRHEKGGLLVIIDDRFRGDHAGRTQFAVYARNEQKARHEKMELLAWAHFAVSEIRILNWVQISDGELGIRLRDYINGRGLYVEGPKKTKLRRRFIHEKAILFHNFGLIAEGIQGDQVNKRLRKELLNKKEMDTIIASGDGVDNKKLTTSLFEKYVIIPIQEFLRKLNRTPQVSPELPNSPTNVIFKGRLSAEVQAQTLLDFLSDRSITKPNQERSQINNPLVVTPDAIVVFGVGNKLLPEFAAPIFAQAFSLNRNVKIVFTGGIGRGTPKEWRENGLSEAEAMSEIFFDQIKKYYRYLPLDLVRSAIIIEKESTNSGANSVFSGKILKELNPKNVLLLHTPFFQLRSAYATWQKQSGLEQTTTVSYSPYLLNTHQLSDFDWYSLAKLMIGELDRLRNYPAQGFTIPISLEEIAPYEQHLKEVIAKIESLVPPEHLPDPNELAQQLDFGRFAVREEKKENIDSDNKFDGGNSGSASNSGGTVNLGKVTAWLTSLSIGYLSRNPALMQSPASSFGVGEKFNLTEESMMLSELNRLSMDPQFIPALKSSLSVALKESKFHLDPKKANEIAEILIATVLAQSSERKLSSTSQDKHIFVFEKQNPNETPIQMRVRLIAGLMGAGLKAQNIIVDVDGNSSEIISDALNALRSAGFATSIQIVSDKKEKMTMLRSNGRERVLDMKYQLFNGATLIIASDSLRPEGSSLFMSFEDLIPIDRLPNMDQLIDSVRTALIAA